MHGQTCSGEISGVPSSSPFSFPPFRVCIEVDRATDDAQALKIPFDMPPFFLSKGDLRFPSTTSMAEIKSTKGGGEEKNQKRGRL